MLRALALQSRAFRSYAIRALCVFCLLAVAGRAFAASPQRITRAIDDAELTALPENVPVAAKHAVDLGAMDGAQQLTELSLRFSMSTAQESALDSLIADQQNPASPRYRQWLTPEQFGAQFGLATSDVAKVSSWLTAQGFTVTQVARGGTFLRFSGTVAQVENAFHTQMRRLSVDGETHFANVSAPVLPTAIAAVTSGITGLHDFHPKSHHREWHVQPAQNASGTGNGATTQFTSPGYTSSTSGSHFIAPGDFYTIYDENALISSSNNGSGVTIAVAGQTNINLADIAAFRSVSGLSVNPPTVQLYGANPGTQSGDLIEAELDVEWSGATAPGASILYVNSTDVIDGSLTQAIDNNLAPIITVSYGVCESAVGQSLLNYYNTLMKMGNAQGQTILAASGDSGATDCDYQVASATQGLAVDFPAMLPSVTGVGGTMFSEASGLYWSSTNGSTGGSAISYIPEASWNEDSSGGLASGGGGSSVYFTKPAWQVGTGVPADSSRDVPDVSLNAASSHDGYLICTTGYCTSGYRNSSGFLDVVGGTSVGAPAFAGMLALVEQKIGGRIGNANPKIYALANSTYFGSVFHDVTIGSNASPCTTGSTGCPSGGTIGYAATAGYDRATGWGSLDAFNLANAWNSVPAIGTGGGTVISATSLAAAPSSVTAGTNIVLTATVVSGATGTTVTPTGTVQFQVDGVSVGSAVTVTAAGTAAYALSTTALSAGTHTVTAAYSGDTTYAGSKGSTSINITAASSADFTITPASTSVTVKSGSTATGVTFTVTSLNGFAGSVTFGSTTTANNLAASYQFTVNPVTVSSTATTGTTTLVLNAFVTNAAGGGLVPVASVRPSNAPLYGGGAGAVMAGVLMLVLPKRRKLAGLLAAVLSVAAAVMSGCGAGGTSALRTATITSTPPGTYPLTVTATGTVGGVAVTHTATVSFIVQ